MNERLDWDLLQGRGFGGFALKSYAILHSAFAEILFIDADNVPVVDPTFLFETPEYQKYGAIFWPDYERMDRNRDIWQICNVPYRDEPEFESGQFVIDKSRHLQPLTLAFFYNANSEFYYQYIHGDKDTFHLAFRRIGYRYAMPQTGIYPLDYTMCQHDFSGRRIFQHRNLAKWRLHQPNLRIHGFEFEQECLDFLEGLATRWDGRIEPVSGENGYARTRLSGLSDRLTRRPYRYHRIGYDTRLMSFQPNGLIGFGAADWERYWEFIPRSEQTFLEIGSVDKPICNLKLDPSGVWRGHWLAYEKMPVELIPA
jgi:hypothetical protein